MKNANYKTLKNIITFSILILLVNSCRKGSLGPASPGNEYEIYIGEYSLLEESLDKLPYYNKTKIKFLDSVNNEVEFEILETDLFESEGTLFKYDIYEEGDTVRYPYKSERKAFYLTNDSLGFRFVMALTAKPYYPDPESQFIADVLTITCRDPDNESSYKFVFSHKTNVRTWPVEEVLEPIPVIAIHNKEFHEVYRMNYETQITQVNFNYEFGVISFTDLEGKLWRFESFE